MPIRLDITLDDDTAAALDAVCDLVDGPRTDTVRALIRAGLPTLRDDQLTLTITADPQRLRTLLQRARLTIRQAVEISLDHALAHPHDAGLLPPLPSYVPASAAK